MSGINDYSPSPGSNTALFPEGMAPSAVNDGMRQVQADIRSWYNSAEWLQFGDGDGTATITYASATSFIVAGADVTGEYHAGRRVKAVGATTGTIYGTIASSAFVTNTTVTVTWDSGGLSNEALTIYLGILRATNPSLPNSDAARTALGLDGVYPRLDSANTFAGDLGVESTDAGATGPSLNLHHDSASPAADDVVGAVNFKGNDSAGNETTYANVRGQIVDATDASEDGRGILQAMKAGTLTAVLNWAEGVWMQGTTGSDPGAGKINATEYQANGTALPFQKAYESNEQTITSGGSLTLAHGLGVQPKLYKVFLKCITNGANGYATGDEVLVEHVQGTDTGVSIVPDATNLNIRYGSATNPFTLVTKTTGVQTSAVNANWRAIFRAWA